MGIVVQKYGGSSLADADAIKRVARRIVEVKKSGHDVVVAVSAMGDTTDDLLDLANGVSPLPPAREMDMLLTAGERISMALVAMAISDLGFTARSFTGSQAGVITDSVHGKAKIIDVTPAWEPVNDRAVKPRSEIAIATRAIEIRSPAVSSMSSSRAGGSGLTSAARSRSSSVLSPMAETATTTS